MKRSLALLLFLCVLLSALTSSVFAHSGRTDAYGGHTNHSTGEYHYHHGKPAHQHPNGVCPYASGSSSSSDEIDVGDIIACVVLAPCFLFILWGIVISPLIDKIKECCQPSPKNSLAKDAAPKPPPKSPHQPPTPPTSTPNPTVKLSPSAPPKPEQTPPKQHSTSTTTHLRGSESAYTPAPQKKQTVIPKANAFPQNQSVSPKANAFPQNQSVSPKAERFSSAPPQAHNFRPSQTLPFASGILKEHPLVLGADPNYLTEAQVLAYALSIDTPRGKKAVTEQFIIKGDLTTNESVKPYQASADIVSLGSAQQYHTTLVRCTCPDHRARHLPCKHMIALAINVNAITVDIEALQK